jgi:hypothetical protein
MHDEQFQPDPDAVAILRASMLHVPFDGWGEAALMAGAADSGYDAAAVHTALSARRNRCNRASLTLGRSING